MVGTRMLLITSGVVMGKLRLGVRGLSAENSCGQRKRRLCQNLETRTHNKRLAPRVLKP